jgi:hypothetical protein
MVKPNDFLTHKVKGARGELAMNRVRTWSSQKLRNTTALKPDDDLVCSSI